MPKKSDSTRNSSDARMSAPLDDIASATWYNTSLSHPSVSDKSSRVCKPVPRNIKQRDVENTEPHPVTQSSRPSKKKRVNYSRRERRARERRKEIEAFIHEAREHPGHVSSSSIPDQLTQPGLLHSDPISAMQPAVYPPVTLEGRPTANENSSWMKGVDLYKVVTGIAWVCCFYVCLSVCMFWRIILILSIYPPLDIIDFVTFDSIILQ